jgi:hypothetical protein
MQSTCQESGLLRTSQVGPALEIVACAAVEPQTVCCPFVRITVRFWTPCTAVIEGLTVRLSQHFPAHYSQNQILRKKES